MALTKAKIATILCERVGFSFTEAKAFINLFFDKICHRLELGENVNISGFGNFELRDKAPRPGRNPKSKEYVLIDARRVVTFKVSQKLRNKVAQLETLPKKDQ